MPRIIMVAAVADGAGAQIAERGVQLSHHAWGGGAYKSAPAPAGGETLRVNDEEVSERMEGVQEGIEGAEMEPPHSARDVPTLLPSFSTPQITPPPTSRLPPSHNPPAPHHKKPYGPLPPPFHTSSPPPSPPTVPISL
ncbi:hypothetical protein JB92DRAFT_3105183 [Gautieria morchelliformis]|nr:hypothetical protein JB92DRAFT_3105183 [Gautieria morchelliformis]